MYIFYIIQLHRDDLGDRQRSSLTEPQGRGEENERKRSRKFRKSRWTHRFYFQWCSGTSSQLDKKNLRCPGREPQRDELITKFKTSKRLARLSRSCIGQALPEILGVVRAFVVSLCPQVCIASLPENSMPSHIDQIGAYCP